MENTIRLDANAPVVVDPIGSQYTSNSISAIP